jgi:threonine/homoserine/homoserine lactone efflux protein
MVIDNSSLVIFVAASLALLLAPGPAVLYVVARSVDQGRMAGIVSVLGISLGGWIHVVAAAVGLSALLVSSALAFTVVKYLGAAYLVYLGITTLMTPTKQVDNTPIVKMSHTKIFRQGMIVNILNPKTALFFFTFIPQFVDPVRGSVALQIVFLGSLFLFMAIVTDGIYAIVAGTLGQWLKNNQSFLKIQKYLSGSIYVFLGVATALSGGDSQ